MANRKNWLGILVIALVFGMMVVGCDDDSTDDSSGGGGGGSTDPALNGTWVGIYESGGSIELHFNNGSFEQIYNNSPYFKGTYTTSGNNVTIKITHLHGNLFGGEAKWYTKTEAKTLLKEFSTRTDAEIDELLNYSYYTRTLTYSVSGNTLTLTETYTDEDGIKQNSTSTLTKK
jgi:uncharacterized lipoprotein YehR (DUF1307 family)